MATKATVIMGDTWSGRPVWLRVTRAIMPRVKVPIAPAVRAWVATLGGIPAPAAAPALRSRPTPIQP
jgi:hypothetical protein